MPNFWTGLGRMLAGKPVFDPNDSDIQRMHNSGIPSSGMDINQVQSSGPAALSTPQPSIVKGNSNTFPVIRIRRVDNHYNGDNVQIYFRIYNDSTVQIWLDRIKVFGREQRINDDLRPHEEHQYPIYSGPQFRNKHDNDAKLKFRTMDGDYFEIDYDIKFSYHHEHEIYECEGLEQHGPVRDIFEYKM